MPKLKLEFQLPEERIEADHALKGEKYLSTLIDLANYFRTRLKHEELDEVAYKTLDETQAAFFLALEERGIDIYEE